jgi:hypothetical protein
MIIQVRQSCVVLAQCLSAVLLTRMSQMNIRQMDFGLIHLFVFVRFACPLCPLPSCCARLRPCLTLLLCRIFFHFFGHRAKVVALRSHKIADNSHLFQRVPPSYTARAPLTSSCASLMAFSSASCPPHRGFVSCAPQDLSRQRVVTPGR